MAVYVIGRAAGSKPVSGLSGPGVRRAGEGQREPGAPELPQPRLQPWLRQPGLRQPRLRQPQVATAPSRRSAPKPLIQASLTTTGSGQRGLDHGPGGSGRPRTGRTGRPGRCQWNTGPQFAAGSAHGTAAPQATGSAAGSPRLARAAAPVTMVVRMSWRLTCSDRSTRRTGYCVGATWTPAVSAPDRNRWSHTASRVSPAPMASTLARCTASAPRSACSPASCPA
jgi:hypothetical protein